MKYRVTQPLKISIKNEKELIMQTGDEFEVNGSLNEKVELITSNIGTVKINYNKNLLDIPDNVKDTKGEGVTIAILDTGCIAHDDLNIVEFYDAENNKSLGRNKYFDQSGHGTFVTGLINSNGKSSGIVGVAPNSEVIIVRVEDQNGYFFPNNLISGLKWIYEERTSVDIINMSFDVTKSESINNYIRKLHEGGKIIVGAAGNNKKLKTDNQNDLLYPALLDGVLAVGSIDDTDINDSNIPLNSFLEHVISPTEDFQSILTGRVKDKKSFTGTSFTTAIVTGALSLVKAHYNKISIRTDAVSTFNSFLTPYKFNSQMSNNKIYRRL